MKEINRSETMKELTLDQTWVLCLRMWKWISRQCLKKGHEPVWRLKEIWLRQNGYAECIASNCFFCHWAKNSKRKVNFYLCEKCPGALVDPKFRCSSRLDINYRNKPRAFYKEIFRLNKIREDQ